MLCRRNFLFATASVICWPKIAFASSPYILRAENVKLSLLSEISSTRLWGFNGSTPGPLIKVKKGGRIKIRFVNEIAQPSTIHWHGIRIDNKMDGVPGLTQKEVKPKEKFDYDFVVPDAGTYWYHSHNRSLEQVSRGLYGALIVEELKPPTVDHDIIVFVDDWRLNQDGSQLGDFDNFHDQAHAGRLGNFAKTLFQNVPKQIRQNERVRLRFINVATDRIFPIQLEGLDGKVVAYDGMPIKKLEPIDDLILAPAQRIDIIADVKGKEIVINFPTRRGLHRLGYLPVSEEAIKENKKDIILLEPNTLRVPDIDNAISLKLKMEGGAMSHRMMMRGMRGDAL